MDVAVVDDHNQLVNALRSFRELQVKIDQVLTLREKMTGAQERTDQTKKELKQSVAQAIPIFGGIVFATSARTNAGSIWKGG